MHYAGISCEMGSILDLAQRHSIPIVEDNAHGLFGKYEGRPLGTFGSLATQSFHETKNFTCGEGGALLLNNRDYIARAEVIWEKGTNRLCFLRGQVEKYTWVDLGGSFLLADLLAAFLWAQLETRAEIQGRRRHIWEFYYAGLVAWAKERGAQLPTVPARAENAYHLFYLLLRTPAERDHLIEYLSQQGIQSAFHYVPLHLSKMGRSFGGRDGDCPVCEDVSQRLLRLPFHNHLTDPELARVVDALVGPNASASTKEAFRKKLRAGELNDKEIEIEVQAAGGGMPLFEIPGMPGAQMGRDWRVLVTASIVVAVDHLSKR